MQILISGASIAGPVLAYWLERFGFTPTVVERAPTLRKTGGHAVDLFRPALEIVERMGLRAAVQARHTGIETLTILQQGSRRRVDVPIGRIVRGLSAGHVEIMRDDLSEIFYTATRERVEYVFGDSIAGLTEDAGGVEVRFERGAPRRFELVIGADGLHSNVRRLVFGPEQQFARYIGAYLAVMSLPNYLGLRDQSIVLGDVDRMLGVYSGQHMDDARAVFLFRPPRELELHHRDVARQKALLRETYRGMDWEVPRLLAMLEEAPAFYFDSVTQLQMASWSRGRVTLAGDAGYCPGPAVGGSTTLAVVGAHALAGELAAAGGDHVRGFKAYEQTMGEYVRLSRQFAIGAAKNLVPGSRTALWLVMQGARAVSRLPVGLLRGALKLRGGALRVHETMAVKDYGAG